MAGFTCRAILVSATRADLYPRPAEPVVGPGDGRYERPRPKCRLYSAGTWVWVGDHGRSPTSLTDIADPHTQANSESSHHRPFSAEILHTIDRIATLDRVLL